VPRGGARESRIPGFTPGRVLRVLSGDGTHDGGGSEFIMHVGELTALSARTAACSRAPGRN